MDTEFVGEDYPQYRSAMFQHASAYSMPDAAYAALILDLSGTIFSCNKDAERLLGADGSELDNQSISTFIPNIFIDCTSPSFRARYIARLCDEADWRGFIAKNAQGDAFLVDLKLSRVSLFACDHYLLRFRRQNGGNPQ